MDSSLLRRADLYLLALLTLVALVGIVTLRGASVASPVIQDLAIRQTAWLCMGLIVFMVAILVDYRKLEAASFALYVFHMIALIALLIFGRSVKGAKSWFDFGLFSWQPAETMKIATVLLLSRMLGNRGALGNLFDAATLIPVAVVALPAVLILLQPDLGTALVYGALTFGMLFFAGVSLRVMGGIIGGGGVIAVCAYPFLHEYQKMRIRVFFQPELDAKGSAHNTIQAKIAVGSGEWFGRGWGQGTQTSFGFLPEFQNDFLFASLGEQFGLLGCTAIIVLYVLIAWRALTIVRNSRDHEGALLSAGLLCIFVTHVLINVGAVLQLLPVTGLPLPLFSAGGSAMLTNFLLFGLIVNVGMRRHLFED